MAALTNVGANTLPAPDRPPSPTPADNGTVMNRFNHYAKHPLGPPRGKSSGLDFRGFGLKILYLALHR